jgi:hypothetical protein
LKNYEDRKRILGVDDGIITSGVEYYVDGIYEIESLSDGNDYEIGKALMDRPTESYVNTFDWTDRHGKCWVTPNRDQGDSGYCCAFASVGAVETLTRLYYNRLINIDLSEQEAACCNGFPNPWYGMPNSYPLTYIRDYGVCDEVAYPFSNDSTEAFCRSAEITPNELVTINNYVSVTRTENEMKNALINHGPLISSVNYWGYNADGTKYYRNHAMMISGYGKLQVGDTIYHYVNEDGSINGAFTVTEDNPHVGRTYWIYKNSYGVTQDEARQGYMWFIHMNYSRSVGPTYYCTMPITSMNYTDNKIVCEDHDGDGYYFWGISDNMPSYCPSWIPAEKDGDDSNASKGILYLESPNVIGELETINPNGISTITINSNTTYTTRLSKRSHIVVASNKTLTVKDILNMFGRPTITVQSGGQLIVDGGVITNAYLNLASGAKLVLKNGGKIVMRTNTTFNAPVGALVDISHGEILRSNDF